MNSPVEIKRSYLASKITRWHQKIYGNIGAAKMVFLGDSTSDLSGNASAILGAFTPGTGSPYVNTGDMMFGFNISNMPNFGNNGSTLVSWLSTPTGAFGLNNLVTANPDLIIFSYGINDVRTNSVTKDQLKALIITAINNIRAALPDADIILRMPNSFRIPTTQLYIQQGAYPSLAAAAQAQTDILYYAYKELENYWPNVEFFNSQDLIFGRVSLATSNLMTDEIHPQYPPIIAKLINLIYPLTIKPFCKDISANAISQSFSAPYTIYNRALENTDYYTLITSCVYNTQGVNYIDVTCVDSSAIVSNFKRGDIINLCDSFFINTNTNTVQVVSIQDATHVRFLFSSNVPANTITSGAFKIYRNKYNNDINTVPYINNRGQYKYIRKANIAGGTNYFDLSAVDNLTVNGILIEYGSTNVQASSWQLLTTNIILVAGKTQINLTGAGFIILNDTTLRIGLTGDFSTYSGNAIIIGTQEYEDPFLVKTNVKLLWGAGATTNIYGKVGIKRNGLKYVGGNGEAGVGGLLYLDFSEPAGNTITSITKTYFASSFIFAPNTIEPGELIQIETEFLVNTSSTPGTLTLTTEIGGNQILIDLTGLVLPTSAVDTLMTLKVNAYLKDYLAGTVSLSGNVVIIVGNTITSLSKDLGNLGGQGINVTTTNLTRLSATFSTTGNSIKMKAMKIFTYNS